jgi:hypothetical protein
MKILNSNLKPRDASFVREMSVKKHTNRESKEKLMIMMLKYWNLADT